MRRTWCFESPYHKKKNSTKEMIFCKIIFISMRLRWGTSNVISSVRSNFIENAKLGRKALGKDRIILPYLLTDFQQLGLFIGFNVWTLWYLNENQTKARLHIVLAMAFKRAVLFWYFPFVLSNCFNVPFFYFILILFALVM